MKQRERDGLEWIEFHQHHPFCPSMSRLRDLRGCLFIFSSESFLLDAFGETAVSGIEPDPRPYVAE
jgi:hypothetical protein